MARSLRASAAAAAKKILAQAADDGDAVDTGNTVKPTSATRRSAGHRRKREEDSPEFDADDGGSDHEEEEDADEEESDASEDDHQSTKKSSARRPTKKIKMEPRLDPEETKRRLDLLLSNGTSEPSDASKPPAKKRKKTTAAKENVLAKRLFSGTKQPDIDSVPRACCPPERRHSVDYHRPLLLNGSEGKAGRRALLAWYDSVSATRGMPWRRDQWLDPRTASPEELGRRAYEVWISEIMAQQTRIAVVIGYWTRWTARWPTVADLAVAEAHEVMHEWSGLGYYSRAARLHEAARVVVSDPVFKGLLPADVATLEDRVPGVGRYTAGAISAIVFGRAAAMVDGNVIRVLSRQLGLFADSKAEKQLVDMLWAAAEALVQAVARDGDDVLQDDSSSDDDQKDQKEPPISDRPGRWGQALMELGSTICAPKPDCAACPITSTCRTYAEGLRLHDRIKGRSHEGVKEEEDMESCKLCEQFPELDDEEAAALAKADKKSAKDAAAAKKTTTSPFFDIEDAAAGLVLGHEALATVVNHARTFPLRRPKKPVREVDTLVCAIRTVGGNGKQPIYLLNQRPDKGLLASLWQLPSYDMPSAKAADLTKAARRKEAEAFVNRWLSSAKKTKSCITTTRVKDLGSIPWLFSHLRQTMHVYLFEVEDAGGDGQVNGKMDLPTPTACCWSSVEEAEDRYSMGTGMRKCWELVKDS
ncbi:a g-specific adenine glycosylase [Ophiostoma piceae UAMH 11346]|uniref:Adenine DNA glycosylase n=1 Tax=Ophiostoma piceae (strain UAMH 11346) TaxID=1262450 RepID=S3C959_OPHP1|nr:a g-specific adenine glycosylase [Ophiostoma piceae UAMH 11346]